MVVQRLICPHSVLHIAEVQEGIAQGANPGREDGTVGELPELVEYLEEALDSDMGGNVAKPHACAGCVGCLPVQVALALEVVLPGRRAAQQNSRAPQKICNKRCTALLPDKASKPDARAFLSIPLLPMAQNNPDRSALPSGIFI